MVSIVLRLIIPIQRLLRDRRGAACAVALGLLVAGLVGCRPVVAPAAPLGPAAPLSAVAALPHPPTLPRLVAEIPLAGDQGELLDLRVDHARQRLYVTTSTGQLQILDANDYTRLTTLPVTGELTLDAPNQRLYVTPLPYADVNGAPTVAVVDTATTAIIGQLPGRALAVDSAGNRLFVGEALFPATAATTPAVRIYDAATLTLVGEVAQAGVPIYNPRRREVLIVAYTLYTADPATGRVTGDLLPELSQDVLPWCNGCRWVDEVQLFPEANLLAVYVRTHCTGGGCNFQEPPRFFDATTLAPRTDLAALPEVQRGCGSARWLLWPMDGRLYRTYAFQRYVIFNNLLVYGADGALLTWRDGLYVRFVNTQTQQAYLAGGDVLALPALTPVGQWPDSCPLAYDADAGLFYGRGFSQNTDNAPSNGPGVLRVIAARGGVAEPLLGPQAATLPNDPINAILVSPAYVRDNTLLVQAGAALYRSRDGGAQWEQLHGGLPEGSLGKLVAAFSPAYGEDQTIFAAGYRNEGRGEGVLRSTDGGDTWTRLWQGLRHLRVTDLLLSPNFHADQSLLVQADYLQVHSGEAGVSWQRSTDGGLHWSVVSTATTASALPPAATFLPALAQEPRLPLRVGGYGQRVEMTTDQGVTWQPAPLTLADDERVQALMAAPPNAAQAALYVLSDYHLWYSVDSGQRWSSWEDSRLAGRDYTRALRRLAISPLLPDGSYVLFVGTANGEFLQIMPTKR
ncbi:MAG: sialidase family protein [Caldilineaceae bacterium]